MTSRSTPILFSGSSHPSLAQEIAALSSIPMGKIDLHAFPDKEIAVDILEPVQGRSVYVLQSPALNPNTYLMELFIMIDALKRASADFITVILPYYAYARQDRLCPPNTSITAKLVANFLATAGIDHLITLDLHSEQIEGFFDLPFTHLVSRPILLSYCKQFSLENAIIVAPDKGAIKIASAYAKQLNLPIALIDKERINAFQVNLNLFVGDVAGKTVFIPDDMCSTAGTIVHAANACAELGAKQIIALIGHGLFTGQAIENIERSPIDLLITTNSIPHSQRVQHSHKIRILSIASLFADFIKKQGFL
ncbi:ribose-phosphate diphosphokinase [Candidatus Protochlamydia phocaeensis]|uniref:ribose-phosphate diphosphokinase n=1 Tax=Candidatus Protochlamydia phocaeensis TaxID=1414722 RepID=UPI00083834E2|nr:ribose-phosphate diphosphokinase [Candidatus Protochlamydia phocaeensis]